MGNLANQMIQAMVAVSLADQLRDRSGTSPRLSNINLPAFCMHHPYVPHNDIATLTVTGHTLDTPALALALSTGAAGCIDIRSYAQRMVNFPSLNRARRLFAHTPPQNPAAGPNDLLCSIRQGDILDGHHPDYVLIPPAFYADMAEITALNPVFFGQIDDSPYMATLRALFPQARFVPGVSPEADFAQLRHAPHIVPAISTFSWLAAWLGHAQTIHLPVLGLFHLGQSPSVDLLPEDDARYRFYQFPYHYAVPVAQVAAAHQAIHRLWRQVPRAAITAQVRPPRDLDALLTQFSEAEYSTLHPDVASAVEGGHFPSFRHHFVHHGFAEGRAPFALDHAFYVTAYPMAGLELSDGHYADIWHHFVLSGRGRGYRRRAPEKPPQP